VDARCVDASELRLTVFRLGVESAPMQAAQIRKAIAWAAFATIGLNLCQGVVDATNHFFRNATTVDPVFGLWMVASVAYRLGLLGVGAGLAALTIAPTHRAIAYGGLCRSVC
jgi:hypothetical protein